MFLLPMWIAFLWQFLKFILDLIKNKKFCIKNFFVSWWFPSVHSAISWSVTTLMFLMYWIDSWTFIVSFSFSALFIYDSFNIRYEAWKHAEYLNKLDKNNNFKQRLWHTQLETLWWIIFWILSTVMFYYICF